MLALHALDGLFSGPVNLTFALTVAVVMAVALRRLARRPDPRLAPLMGVMAAFVFAAQLVNFPVLPGVTGHLLGGTLAAILLGPWAGTLVMVGVVFFQALLGDGGLTVLGPNVFNMGVLGTCVGYGVYRAALGGARPALAAAGRPQQARLIAASFFAAWVAVVLAAVFVSLQLAWSGTAKLPVALLALTSTHMLIGVGEAAITALLVSFVLKTRPELIYDVGHARRAAADIHESAATPPAAAGAWPAARVVAASGSMGAPSRGVVAGGLGLALAVAVLLSLLPALWPHPDGLEYVGIEQGFVLEEPEFGTDGELCSLPAYRLGVRLAPGAEGVRVVHVYPARQAEPAAGAPAETANAAPTRDQAQAAPGGDLLAVGDEVVEIGGAPVPDLNAAAAAMGYGAESGAFDFTGGPALRLKRIRGGAAAEIELLPATPPRAGATRPMVALLPDYSFPGVPGWLGTSLAGAVGTLVMFAASLVVGRVLVRPSALERELARTEPRP